MSESFRSKARSTKAKQRLKGLTKRSSILEEIRLEAKSKGLDRMTMRDIIREIKRCRREQKQKENNTTHKRRAS